METRTILLEAIVNYPDESQTLTHALANIYREYADWLDDVGPDNVQGQGEIGLPSGMMKWRVVE